MLAIRDYDIYTLIKLFSIVLQFGQYCRQSHLLSIVVLIVLNEKIIKLIESFLYLRFA